MQRFDFSDLSNAERMLIAGELLASISTPEFTPEQMAEIERRIALMDAGKMAAIPAEQFFAEFERKHT